MWHIDSLSQIPSGKRGRGCGYMDALLGYILAQPQNNKHFVRYPHGSYLTELISFLKAYVQNVSENTVRVPEKRLVAEIHM